MKKLVPATLLFIILVNPAFSQTHFYPKVGLNTSFTSFSDDDYVSKALSKNPATFYNLGIGLSTAITDRSSFQAEIMLPTLGYNVSLASDYYGNKKWFNKFNSAGYIRQQQLNLSWQFDSKPDCSGWIKYVRVGGSAFFKFMENDFKSSYVYKNENPLTGVIDSASFFIEENAGPYIKPGLLLGIGLKRTIKNHNFLSFGLTYQQGFSTLSTTKITYQVDGQTFTNHLLNRGSALVLEASYGFAIRKKKPLFPGE